jgi:hypothetical protein
MILKNRPRQLSINVPTDTTNRTMVRYFQFKAYNEKRPRLLDMGCAGPWYWSEVNAKLERVYGPGLWRKGDPIRRDLYQLVITQVSGDSAGDLAHSTCRYVIKRYPSGDPPPTLYGATPLPGERYSRCNERFR